MANKIKLADVKSNLEVFPDLVKPVTTNDSNLTVDDTQDNFNIKVNVNKLSEIYN